jgi:phytoene dehydrogenase-like protein
VECIYDIGEAGVRYDFVVIGAGVSGITAAVILAKNGFHVALVEKSSRTAPLVKGFIRNGISFQTGIHYIGGLGNGEILETLFNYLGLRERVETIAFDPDEFDRARCFEPAFEFKFPYGYERLQDKLREVFPKERDAADKFLRDIRETFQSFPYISLDPDLISANIAKGVHGISLKDYLDRLTTDDRLKWVLSRHCLLHGVPADEAAFDYHATVVASMFNSVHTIKGGGARLGQAFDEQLATFGVEVFCGQGVSHLMCSSDRKVSAVELEDGCRLGCRGVVSTVHPCSLLGFLPGGVLRPAYCRRLELLEETISAFMVFGSCKGSGGGTRPQHMVGTPNLEIAGFGEKRPLGSRSIFLSIEPHEKAETNTLAFSAICPAGFQETERWAGTTHNNRPTEYREFKARMADEMLRQAERYWPELEGRLSVTDSATPLTFRDHCHTPSGSIFGVKHKIGQYNPLPMTRVEGLWLAGQATVAPGVMGAMVSAFLTCGFILGHDKLMADLRSCRCGGSS